jgi:hypothetical protein
MVTNNHITLLGEPTHPEYTSAIAEEWRIMRDTYRGESAIKARGERYLPMPSGFKFHPGGPEVRDAMYDAYMKRARFPEIVTNAIRGMVGIAHSQDWQIDLPAALEPMRERLELPGILFQPGVPAAVQRFGGRLPEQQQHLLRKFRTNPGQCTDFRELLAVEQSLVHASGSGEASEPSTRLRQYPF